MNDIAPALEPAASLGAKINGKPVTFKPHETILQCARRHDFHIPTLCELDDIDHTPGTCRVCLVEARMPGQDRSMILTSCNTPMQEGIEVQTRTAKVRDMQRLQVELLMADHALECATCVRHGNCELQDVAQFVGLHESRFANLALIAERPVDRSSPALIRDMTKCVRCQRCVAVCRHGQGVDALVISGTKHGTFVGLKDGLSQKVSNCVTCGQCVLVCPTGALGERDETDKVIDYLYDPEIITVVQFAPAIRVGFGEEFGLPPGTNVQGQIIAACRKLGFDIVLDTNFAADVVIMEEGTELLSRLGKGHRPNLHLVLPGLDQLRRTTLPGGPAAAVEHQVATAVPRRHRQDAICPNAWGSTPDAFVSCRSCRASPRKTKSCGRN